jgi:serine protease Do
MSLRSTRVARATAGLAGAALVVAACGGSSENNAADTLAPASPTKAPNTVAAVTTTAAPTTRAGGDGLTLSDILPSLVQIETSGAYRAVGDSAESSTVGVGSGFIISADGLAVTNNHVVAGAATVEVFVGGSKDPVSAKVMGTSECEDLAVIKLAGSGYTPLAWSTKEVEPGQEIFLAGFPLGDPEPTLTKGIIAKAKSDGDVPWASIDHTIEHDASSQPGNSGGPLLDSDGDVIGIHYASFSSTNTAQFQAIASDLARPVAEQLKTGSVLTLGLNGEAFVNEDGSFAGIWAQGITDGSPAARMGMEPGDILTSLKGLPMGTDGTMSDFCKVLRSANDGVEISAEVLRLDSGEFFEGSFFGDELSFVGSLQVDEPPSDDPTDGGETYTPTTYVDETGSFAVDLPLEWPEIDVSPSPDFDNAPRIVTSPDIAALLLDDGEPPAVPGMQIILGSAASLGLPDTSAATIDQVLAQVVSEVTGCQIDEPYDDVLTPYSDAGPISGRSVFWRDCSNGSFGGIFLGFSPDGTTFGLMQFAGFTDADLSAVITAQTSLVLQ